MKKKFDYGPRRVYLHGVMKNTNETFKTGDAVNVYVEYDNGVKLPPFRGMIDMEGTKDGEAAFLVFGAPGGNWFTASQLRHR